MTRGKIVVLSRDAVLLSLELFHWSESVFVSCTYVYAVSQTVWIFALSLYNTFAIELFSIKERAVYQL